MSYLTQLYKAFQLLRNITTHFDRVKCSITQKFNFRQIQSLMGRLLNFIIIDEFKCRRLGSVYFLTHWHADHYDGITNNWTYGPIFCSPITSRLLLSKYPKLADNVFPLKYNEENTITQDVVNFFGANQTIELKIKIYDSNHMAGSIMILIQYEGQYFLHTGDMRFNETVAENLTDLFFKVSSQKDPAVVEYQCQYKIEKLYLDNTFCDPIFMFPPRSFALKLVTKIIEQYKPSRVFICTDSVGKEEAFVYLSEKYKCRIKVNKDRKRYIKCMGLDYKKYFTTKDEVGVWIESIRKSEKQARVSQTRNSIAITLTGWANLNDYHPIGYNSFVVPYSLHSNYRELELFVRSVRPKRIIPIVSHREQRQSDHFREKIGSYESYMMSLSFIKQRGLEYLKKTYQTGNQQEEQSEDLKEQKGCEEITSKMQDVQL